MRLSNCIAYYRIVLKRIFQNGKNADDKQLANKCKDNRFLCLGENTKKKKKSLRFSTQKQNKINEKDIQV